MTKLLFIDNEYFECSLGDVADAWRNRPAARGCPVRSAPSAYIMTHRVTRRPEDWEEALVCVGEVELLSYLNISWLISS